jgi:hypothetical protein
MVRSPAEMFASRRGIRVVKAFGLVSVTTRSRLALSSSVPGAQSVDVVRVEGPGPVRIVDAPEGNGKVKGWAQRRGRLKFVAEDGVSGVLNLKDDSIALSP